ncbi:MAG: phosphoribosylaminoimidazolesuccinocarboxamide synthase [Candidatus Falkowbacteria bacterium]
MTEKIEKGEIISHGKTKEIHSVLGRPNSVILKNKDEITKNDDKSLTKTMASKAEYATATTCMVFQLLKEAGIPVAFESQISPTEFLAPKCAMIPLEVIIRRYADGSCLKRSPNLKTGEGQAPHRFHKLVFELFLKTTEGKFSGKSGNELSMSNDVLSDNDKPVDDPFIANPYDSTWTLKNPKIPTWDAKSDLGLSVANSDVLPTGIKLSEIEKITRQVFLILENAWAQLGCRLIDFKIEFGIDADGNLLVADVIDNDSWRLRTADWKELSKQLFRDNFSMEEISEKYALVAKLVERFALPKQVIVFWRGSEGDALPKYTEVPGVDIVLIVRSGHKSPAMCIDDLEQVLASYPQGGVIIALVGLSNGLGPTLASRTSWPVISVPASWKEAPHDVWSSLSMPSNVPTLTVLSVNNAYLAALNILAPNNGAAYMTRQYIIETFDK